MEHVNGFGPLDATIAIIGEAPGAEERRQGKPFVGPSGQLLRESLEKVGLDPDTIYITNVYKEYRYGNPTPTAAEIKEAMADLADELTELPNLEAILVLGNTPLQGFTGLKGITKHRGLQDKVLIDFEGTVFATLHPAAILRNLQQKSAWLQDLAAFAALVNDVQDDYVIHHVQDAFGRKACEAQMEQAKGLGALDIETTVTDVLEEVQIITVAVSFNGYDAWVVDHTSEQFPKMLRMLSGGRWIMHNGSFDRLILQAHTEYEWTIEHDTMAMQYLLHPEEQKGLEVLSSVYLGLPPYKGIDYKHILDEPIEEVVKMNGRDAARTYQLFRPLADELNRHPHLSRTYQWLLLPAIPALTDLTVRGVPVDRERLASLQQALELDLSAALGQLQAQVGDPGPEYGKVEWPKGEFNPGSPQQVAHVLFDQLGLPVLEKTDTGAPSTSAKVLDQLIEISDDPILREMKKFRKASKLLSYIKTWNTLMGSDDRLHPKYKPTQVLTGRLAAEKPNIQQVPRDPRFRGVFGGVPGYTWVKADLSQIELRLAAWIANESAMLRAYQEGADLHSLTAERILGMTDPTMEYEPGVTGRQVGKTLNFGLLYGAYPAKLREVALSDYGVSMTLQEASEYRAAFFDSYPGLAQMHTEVKSTLHATGRIESPLGRVRTFPDVYSDDEWAIKQAEREAVNHPIQSFASDILLSTLVRLPEDVRQYAIATVHDELDFLVPEDEVERVAPIIKATMEDVSWLKKWGIDLDVPVLAEIEIGDYWK